MTEEVRKALEEFAAKAISAIWLRRYGPPSAWEGQNPKGWHLARQCTATDACMHDNGCIAAMNVILALQKEDVVRRFSEANHPRDQAESVRRALAPPKNN